MKSEEEFYSLDDKPGANEVTDVPQGFKDWVAGNKDRITAAGERGTQPYFIRDNKEVVDDILKPKVPKKTALEVAKERHAARTQKEAEMIKHKWDNHKEYAKLKIDSDYRDVKFNYDNGGD